jgi:hypothetical protein
MISVPSQPSSVNAKLTLNVDKGHEVKEFIDAVNGLKVIRHIAKNSNSLR